MATLVLTITGDTTPDLEDALEEVKRLVSEGFTSGQAGNDTGRFIFDITNPPE